MNPEEKHSEHHTLKEELREYAHEVENLGHDKRFWELVGTGVAISGVIMLGMVLLSYQEISALVSTGA